MRVLDKIKAKIDGKNKWTNDILFWVILLVVYAVMKQNANYTLDKSIVKYLILILPQISAFYFIAYYLNPKFLNTKKYLTFSILFFLSTYVFSFLARFLVVHVVEDLFREPPFVKESIYEIATDIRRLYEDFFYIVYLPVFLFLSLKLWKDRTEVKRKNIILEKEKVTAELNFLKTQIHPHFLFNTLNNLYVLTLQKSEKAPETVLKLSEMLDYILYKGGKSTVTITQEIELLQNYIDLEKLRYGDRLSLVFEKEIDNPHTSIAPLLLISLLENAFKHGASGSTGKPEIKINIKVIEKKLFFSICNSKPIKTHKEGTNFEHGIGLSNTKNQLQLLYPHKHSMVITEKKNSFLVELLLNLNSI